MNLFHSHILLRKSDDRKLVSTDEKQALKDYFFRMLQKEKEYMPAEFCLEVFFKYLMYKEALLFLFWRGEHDRLLTFIHGQYMEEKTCIEKLRAKLVEPKVVGTSAKQRTEE